MRPEDRAGAAAERGFRLLSEGKWSHAMGAFRHALDLDPNHAPARCGLGRVFIETGYWSGAEANLLRAIELRPEYGDAELGLATLYFRMGRYDDAERRVLEAARNGAGESPRARHLLGLFAERRGMRSEAEAHYREGLRAAPGDEDLRLALVDLLRAEGRYREALEEIERERFMRGKEDEIRLRLADCRLHTGQELEAERLYRQLALSGAHAEAAREGLILLSLRRGDAEETARHLLAYAGLLEGEDAARVRDLVGVLASTDPLFSFLERCREVREEASDGLKERIDRWIRELEERSP